MRPIDSVFASLIALALVAALVSGHAKTSTALTEIFTALKKAVTTLMQPVGGG